VQFSLSEFKKIYKYLIILNIFLLAFIIYQLFYSKYYWTGINEKKFVVERGKNLDEIIDGIKSADVIPSS